MNLSSSMTIEQIENMRKETEEKVKAVISNQDTRRSEPGHHEARRNEPRQQGTRQSETMRKKWLNTYIVKNIFN